MAQGESEPFLYRGHHISTQRVVWRGVDSTVHRFRVADSKQTIYDGTVIGTREQATQFACMLVDDTIKNEAKR